MFIQVKERELQISAGIEVRKGGCEVEERSMQ
jgi:hypothetical protein